MPTVWLKGSSASSLHRAVVEHLDAGLPQLGEQQILEPAAIELERRYRRKRRRPQLDAPGKIAIVALREKVAQPELLQLARAQMRFELQHDLQVVRADLDRRLTDLERRFADRMLALLDDQHPHVRRFEVQLARQREAGKAAAENDCVVTFACRNRAGTVRHQVYSKPRHSGLTGRGGAPPLAGVADRDGPPHASGHVRHQESLVLDLHPSNRNRQLGAPELVLARTRHHNLSVGSALCGFRKFLIISSP